MEFKQTIMHKMLPNEKRRKVEMVTRILRTLPNLTQSCETRERLAFENAMFFVLLASYKNGTSPLQHRGLMSAYYFQRREQKYAIAPHFICNNMEYFFTSCMLRQKQVCHNQNILASITTPNSGFVTTIANVFLSVTSYSHPIHPIRYPIILFGCKSWKA